MKQYLEEFIPRFFGLGAILLLIVLISAIFYSLTCDRIAYVIEDGRKIARETLRLREENKSLREALDKISKFQSVQFEEAGEEALAEVCQK